MPFPLAALAVGLGTKAIGGLLKGGGKKDKKQDRPDTSFNLGVTSQAQSYLDQISSSSFGLREFSRLASSSQPGLDTYLGMASASGALGFRGNILAREQFKAARAKSGADLLNQYGQFRLGLQTQAIPNALSILGGFQQFPIEARLFRDTERARNKQAQKNALINLFGNALGTAGGIIGAKMLKD